VTLGKSFTHAQSLSSYNRMVLQKCNLIIC